MTSENWMSALKLFLPSWNFFNDFGEVSRLEYRLTGAGMDSGEWQPVFPRHSTHGIGRIFFNPTCNLELLEQSMVARAVDELSRDPAAKGSTIPTVATHEMLVRLVRGKVEGILGHAAADRFRFRLVTVEPGAAPKVVLSSAELPLKEPEA